MQPNHNDSSQPPEFTALLVSSRADGCARFIDAVKQIPCEIQRANGCRDASRVLLGQDIAVIVTDAELSDGSWKTVVENARRHRTPPNVIVVSNAPDWHLWADVLTSGGFDLLSPPANSETAVWMIQSACRRWRRARDVNEARRQSTRVTELYH